MEGRGLTDTHFLLAFDITRRTRRSLVQLWDRGGFAGERPGEEAWPPYSCGSGGLPHPPAGRLAHQCRALALQYLRSLSGSTTCPFLQHWPHTNFICRSKVLGPCVRGAPCWGKGLVNPKASGLRPGVCHAGGPSRGVRAHPEPQNEPARYHLPERSNLPMLGPPASQCGSQAWEGALIPDRLLSALSGESPRVCSLEPLPFP